MQLVRIRVEKNLLTYKRPVGNIPSGRRDFDKANTLPEECERLQARGKLAGKGICANVSGRRLNSRLRILSAL